MGKLKGRDSHMKDYKDSFKISETVSGNSLIAFPGKNDGRNVILLKSAVPGKNYLVEKIIGGHGISGRLNAMGIVPKEVIKVVFQTWGGPMTVAVKGVRIALGRGISHKIEVSELSSE
jgi:ferrous iron transport protein A